MSRSVATISPPRRRRTPEEAEREILDSADRLLRERPSRDVSVSAIMAGTTLSRKSFYVYFRDRHDMIARLVAPLREQADSAMEPWEPGERDPLAGGRAALLGVARLYKRHGPLLRALAEASREDSDARLAWREFVEPPIAQIAAGIRAGIEAGRIAPLDPEQTARALVGMNLYAFFERLEHEEPEELVEPLVEIWTRTLFGRPPGWRG